MLVDYEIVVAGGGPAGLTAALFAARHGRRTALCDPLGMGGAIMNTERVEDFPGFPDGVSGFELGPRMQEQVVAAGGTVEMADVARVERHDGNWRVVTDANEITAGAVIVATGSKPRKLGVPGEDVLEGKGLSHCASCDGPLFRGQAVAMVGAGDSALLEALELAPHDVRVTLVHRGEALSGQATYAGRVLACDYVEVKHHTTVEEIVGNGRVEGVRVRDLATDEASTLSVAGVFVHIGRVPNTELLAGIVALDERGCVSTDAWMQTELPGLYAAGDVRANSAGQAITAAGDGATAAIAAHHYLRGRSQ